MVNGKKAKKLIKEADEVLTISGATIIAVEKEMKEINKKSQENIKKLSLLL